MGFPQNNATGFSIQLSNDFSQQLNYPIDIRVLNFASVPFRFQMVSGKLLHVKADEIHSKFLEETIRRYLDIKPILYRATKEAFAE
ncbi:MAG: hypothetical protein C4530_24635 [Desulfobacteraceae bacterium]|nr:MAG: hypothetical protein C4530_24635 [Desulfobacteraceae bacterium]